MPYYSDKENFGRKFVKQTLTINDTSAAWRVAYEKFETGFGLEFDAQIMDHENKINKAKKRKRQTNNDGPNNFALSRKLKKTTKILIQNFANFSILFLECQIQI